MLDNSQLSAYHEKQVWGAGAVLAAVLAIAGIVTQIEDEDDWDEEAKIEHVIQHIT